MNKERECTIYGGKPRNVEEEKNLGKFIRISLNVTEKAKKAARIA